MLAQTKKTTWEHDELSDFDPDMVRQYLDDTDSETTGSSSESSSDGDEDEDSQSGEQRVPQPTTVVADQVRKKSLASIPIYHSLEDDKSNLFSTRPRDPNRPKPLSKPSMPGSS